MIIQIFIILLVITMAFILAGTLFKIPAMIVVGISFLFMLGIVVMQTGIEYKTGQILDDNGANTIITNTYSTFTNTTFGIFICVIAVFWFIITMLNLRGDNNE